MSGSASATNTPRSDVSMRPLSNSQSSLSACSYDTPRLTPAKSFDETSKVNDYETILIAIEFSEVTLFPLLRELIAKHPNALEYTELMKSTLIMKPLSPSAKDMEALIDNCTTIKAAMETLNCHIIEKYWKRKAIEEMKNEISRDRDAVIINFQYNEEVEPLKKLLEEVQPVYLAVKRDLEKLEESKEHKVTDAKYQFLKKSYEKFLGLRSTYQTTVNSIAAIDDKHTICLLLLEEKYRKLLKEQTHPFKKATKKIDSLLKEIDHHIAEIIGSANEVLKN